MRRQKQSTNNNQCFHRKAVQKLQNHMSQINFSNRISSFVYCGDATNDDTIFWQSSNIKAKREEMLILVVYDIVYSV